GNGSRAAPWPQARSAAWGGEKAGVRVAMGGRLPTMGLNRGRPLGGFRRPGRGAVWLARLNGVQEVAGSNPVAPTSKGTFIGKGECPLVVAADRRRCSHLHH